MTYVVVHLVGDDATRAAARLVKYLEAERPAGARLFDKLAVSLRVHRRDGEPR